MTLSPVTRHGALVILFTLTRAQGAGKYEMVGSKSGSPSRVQQYALSLSRVEHYALSPSRVQQYALTKRADAFNAGTITARRTSPYGGPADSPIGGGGGGGGGGGERGGARSPHSASVTSVHFFCVLITIFLYSLQFFQNIFITGGSQIALRASLRRLCHLVSVLFFNVYYCMPS